MRPDESEILVQDFDVVTKHSVDPFTVERLQLALATSYTDAVTEIFIAIYKKIQEGFNKDNNVTLID